MSKRLYQPARLLLPLLLALALAACSAPPWMPTDTPAVVQDTPPPPVPTARIIPMPTPEHVVRIAASPPTAADAAANPDAPADPAAQAPPVRLGPVTREGPGGLPYPLRLARLEYGAVGQYYYTDRDQVFQKASEAGFGWVRQQIHWRDIEDQSGEFFWADLDNIVDDANRYGLLVMLSVVRSPDWYTSDGSDGMPANPDDLARFLGTLASHYQGRVHAIQVWNEPNLAHETGGTVTLDDAGRYVELLAASYTAIKAADPAIIVTAAGMAPTAINDPSIAVPDVDFLRAMYAYRNGMMADYFDVQAIHPYGAANPPETLYPEQPSNANGWNEDPTFYFRHIENVRRVMEQAGLAHHQVWVTEFGWATPNNSPGYEYGNQISYERQRDYIVQAMQMTFERYPWVTNMFLWNLNFTIVQREAGVDPQHEQGSFSILNEDGSPRPAYTGIRDYLAQVFAAGDQLRDVRPLPADAVVAAQPTATPAPAAPTSAPDVAAQPTAPPPPAPTAAPPEPTAPIAGGVAGSQGHSQMGSETGNEIGGNEIGGNEISGNEISDNEISDNEIGGNEISDNEIGGKGNDAELPPLE